VGFAKYLRSVPQATVFASYLVRFRVDSRLAHPGFVGRVVESAAYKRYVAANAGGAAQPNANARTLGAFFVATPPIHVQHRVATILSAFDELIEINERRIELLEDLARSLYREWFVHFRFPGATPTVDRADLPESWVTETLGAAGTWLSGGTPSTTNQSF